VSGIRIHHELFKSCTYAVEVPLAYGRPYDCNECKKVHHNKVIHLRLDADGNGIVSKEILATLKTQTPAGEIIALAGLSVTNEVQKPPTQVIGAVDRATYEVIDRPLNLDMRATDIYVPGVNKYQSRDRIHKGLIDALGTEG